MDDVPALLRRLVATDPGRPRVTWYGPDGERVELSGKVLDNWVSKTANLLVDALDAGPGHRVVVDLPAHWRTVVWLLATWSVGACVVVEDGPVSDAPDAEPVEILVTGDPAAAAAGQAAAEQVVAVALPALATSFGAPLPPGATDYATDVRTFGDVFVPFVRPTPADPAFADLRGGRQTLSIPYNELLRWTSHEAGLPEHTRLLTGGRDTDPLLDLLAPLLTDGSVVIHHDPETLTDEEKAKLESQENVTETRLRP